MSLLLAPLPFSNWSESRKISKRRRAAGCAWDLHLEKSRDFICEALPSKRSGRGVVLGSGPLFDVPLKELAASFETVVFVDLYHPKAAKVAAAQYENVELVSCDVTGIAKPLRAAVRTGKDLPQPEPPQDLFKDADLVVSLNLISQIPVAPHQLLSKYDVYDEAFVQDYMAGLIQNHLDWLKTSSGQVVLIGDFERQYLKDGQIQSREDLLFGVQLPKPDATWDWDIAPAPLADPVLDLRHKVLALKF